MNELNQDRAFYNQRFLQELELLNDAQRQAVENIEGPMLVVAGPGTGKTHMLSARIGWILLKTDAQASNILCLTFTEAGVKAMRNRLLHFIGPEAYKINIYTFHSFCNSIIRDNLELFGRRGLEPLSELERVDLIRTLIDELPHQHILKRGRLDPYFYEEHLFALFKQMKTENWTINLITDAVQHYLDDLPNRKAFIYQVNRGDFKKGDLKVAQVKTISRRMEQLVEAAKLFPRYLELMRIFKRYDYDDMILWVLRAFEQYPALLRSYQERYLYLLVDEYQDTNGAQNEIIKKLTAYWDHPNLFIVGDDDQSIYEFQGARLKNLLEFYELYKNQLIFVLLTQNYRSTPAILDRAHDLISFNQKRIINAVEDQSISKKLLAQHPANKLIQQPVQVDIYPNQLQEVIGICDKIELLHKEGVALEEIGVLFAKHQQAEMLLELLEKKAIPFYVKKEINILAMPIIEQLRKMLSYFALESKEVFSGEHLLYQLFYQEFLGIKLNDLGHITTQLASISWQKRPKWRTIIASSQWLSHFGVKNSIPFNQLSSFIDDQLHRLYSVSLPAYVEGMINQSGLLQYANQQDNRQLLIQALASFLSFVRSETNKRPRLSLQGLLELLDKMDAARINLPLERLISSGKGVQLLTAHSAKGLEFEHVFLLDCIKDHWEPATRRNNYRFRLPDTLTYSGEEDALEARRRLFFVAMTRAKTSLTLSYSQENNKGKTLEPAQFINEIRNEEGIVFEEKKISTEDITSAQLIQLAEVDLSLWKTYEKEAIRVLLSDFVLSVSSLNSYLKCPIGFFYEHLLKVPVQFSEYALFGIAVHNSLQRLFDQMSLNRKKDFPNLKMLIRIFDQEMREVEGGFAPKHFARKLDDGKRQLEKYYQANIGQWPKQVKTELVIRHAEWQGIPITGIIDRLDFLGKNKLRIVDYKTGNPDPKKVKPPTDAKPYGGNYWRQLYFYKILLDQSNKQLGISVSGVISFLNPDKLGDLIEREIIYEQEGIKKMQQIIKEVYTNIMDLKFQQGCGEPSCPWCDFVNKKNKINSFSQRDLEELDD